ncbi:MAG: FG-GAP-like repeat-containing protein [Bacteroidota bacterium]|nr:FG-GAP-like repeat-containing protein [Bacteroidota bacterium]
MLIFIIVAYSFVHAQIKFDNKLQYETGQQNIESVTIADINNDCLNDVLIMNSFDPNPQNSRTIQIFSQTTSGNLILSQKFFYKISNSYSFSYSVVKVGEFNSDGKKDIALTFRDTLKIIYQDPSGIFTNSLTIKSEIPYIHSMDIGDINQDGLTDIVIGGKSNISNELTLSVYYQQTNESFTKQNFSISGNSLTQIKLANVNNDCIKDIVALTDMGVSVVYIKTDPSKISLVNKKYEHTNYYKTFNGIVVGRYGKDLHNSIFITTGGNKSVNYQIAVDSSGKLSDSFAYFDGGEIPKQIAMTDFNNDGLNEIVVAHQSWNYFDVFNDSASVKYNRNLYKSIEYGTTNCTSMDVGDLNFDGLPDIIIGNTDNKFEVHYNTSKPVVPLLNYAIAVFYDCQTLKTKNIPKYSYFTKSRLLTGTGCNISILDSFRITQNFETRFGLGDSLYYTTYCKKNPVYIKQNETINAGILKTSDTAFYKRVSRTSSFPKSNYSITGLKEICLKQSISLILKTDSLFKYDAVWHWNSDSLISNSFTINNLNEGKHQIPIKVFIKNDTTYCSKNDTINAVVYSLPVDISIIGKDTLCEGEKQIPYNIQSGINGIHNWTFVGIANPSIENQSNINLDINDGNSFTITAQEQNNNGCYGNIASKNVFVRKFNDCLIFPNVITPNNDGVNDQLTSYNIELFPENSLKIYNRWGSIVYQAKNYTGIWSPVNQSDGIYYYLFETNKKKINGWLELIR